MCFILLSCIHLNGAQLHEHEFVPMDLTLKEVICSLTMMDRHSDTQFIYVSRIFNCSCKDTVRLSIEATFSDPYQTPELMQLQAQIGVLHCTMCRLIECGSCGEIRRLGPQARVREPELQPPLPTPTVEDQLVTWQSKLVAAQKVLTEGLEFMMGALRDETDETGEAGEAGETDETDTAGQTALATLLPLVSITLLKERFATRSPQLNQALFFSQLRKGDEDIILRLTEILRGQWQRFTQDSLTVHLHVLENPTLYGDSVLELLLNNGADLMACYPNGASILHSLAQRPYNLKLIGLILKKQPLMINCTDKYGCTIWHILLPQVTIDHWREFWRHHCELFPCLNVDIQDANDQSILHLLSQRSDDVETLREMAGNLLGLTPDLSLKDKNGKTAYDLAIARPDLAELATILQPSILPPAQLPSEIKSRVETMVHRMINQQFLQARIIREIKGESHRTLLARIRSIEKHMDMSFQQLQEKIKFVEDGVDQNIAAIENPIIKKFYIEFRNSLFAMYQYLLIFSTGNLETPFDTSKIDTIEHFVGLGCSLLGAMPIPFIDFIAIALSEATEATTILVKKRLAKKSKRN